VHARRKLIRPDDVIAIMRRLDAGEAVDPDEHQAVLAPAVRDVVRRQRQAGVDVVSDGEYGKSAWNYYVYERLVGIELREHPPGEANFASVNDAPTDWTRFPEFYADYFANEQEYESPGGDWTCVAPITYTGQPAIRRDIANLTAAMDAEGAEEGFLPVVAPASCFPTLIDEHYGSERAALMGVAEALREEYRAIVDADLETGLRELTTAARGCPMTAWRLAQDGGEVTDEVLQARIATVMLGAALAALDDDEAFVRACDTESAPDHRRWLGIAIGRIETAGCILGEAALAGDDPAGLWILSREVSRLAYTTVQDLIVHSGAAQAASGRLARTVSTMVTLWGHPLGALDDEVSRRLARERLGL
jgi:methionine synthase II (cobalamin-independent)